MEGGSLVRKKNLPSVFIYNLFVLVKLKKLIRMSYFKPTKSEIRTVTDNFISLMSFNEIFNG